MTEDKPTCQACSGETFKEGLRCPACLKAYMETMTPSDWQRALSDVVDRVVSGVGEDAKR